MQTADKLKEAKIKDNLAALSRLGAEQKRIARGTTGQPALPVKTSGGKRTPAPAPSVKPALPKFNTKKPVAPTIASEAKKLSKQIGAAIAASVKPAAAAENDENAPIKGGAAPVQTNANANATATAAPAAVEVSARCIQR